jgi:hypothetical protein
MAGGWRRSLTDGVGEILQASSARTARPAVLHMLSEFAERVMKHSRRQSDR